MKQEELRKIILDKIQSMATTPFFADQGVSFEDLQKLTGLEPKQLKDLIDDMQNKGEIEEAGMPLWYRLKTKPTFPEYYGFDTDFIKICSDLISIRPVYFDRAGVFWVWNFERNCWEMQDETDVLNVLYETLRYAGLIYKKDKLLTAIKMVARQHAPKDKSKKWIQFKDVVFNLDTSETLTATSNYFFVNPLPYKLGESEETPTIDKMFEEWVGQEDKIMLYEAVAYCMLEDYPIHRLFAFIGSGRNGKGTFLRLIHRFIGEQNSTSTSLDKLRDSRFEASKLYKKTVAFVGETNFTEIRESALLKSLTGQDLIGAEFKNKAPFDFYNYAKLLIATNSLPITHDKTQGFYSRWILVNFPYVFNAGKDKLLEIPEVEFENLGRKCVHILKELLDRGYFAKEKNLEDKARDYEEKSNPLVSFVRDKCQKDPYGSIALWEFYEEFVPYLTQHGYRIMSKKEVSSLLRQMGYEVERRTTTRNDEQKTYFMILNIAFITESTEITVLPLNTRDIGSEYNNGNLGNVSNDTKESASDD